MEERPGPSSRRTPRVTTPARYTAEDPPARPDNGRRGYYDISEILDRRIVPKEGKPDGELQYLIRWVGYDEQEDSWESLAHIRDMRLVLTFERRLEEEGPSFLPNRRARDAWMPLSRNHKADIRRFIREGRQLDSDSDELTEDEQEVIPPQPRVDVEPANMDVADEVIMPAPHQAEQVEEQEEEEQSEEEEDDEVEEEQEVIELGDTSESESEWEDYALFANLSPPPPPPTPPSPPRSPSPECLMEPDTTAQPAPRSRPDSPDVPDYIPPLLRGWEPPTEQADPASTTVPQPTSAEQTAGTVDPSAVATALPPVTSAEQPSAPAEPAGSSTVSGGQPEVATAPLPTSAEPMPAPANQPAVPANQPAVSANQPAVPANQPAVPANLPTIPADQPPVPADQPAGPSASAKNPPNQDVAPDIILDRIKRNKNKAAVPRAGTLRRPLPVPGKRTVNKRNGKSIDVNGNECAKKARTAFVASSPPCSSASDLLQSSPQPCSSASIRVEQSNSSTQLASSTSNVALALPASNNQLATSASNSSVELALPTANNQLANSASNSSVALALPAANNQLANSASNSSVALALPAVNNQLASTAANSSVALASPLPAANNQLVPANFFQPIPLPWLELPLPDPYAEEPYPPLALPLPENNAIEPAAFQPYAPLALPLPENNAIEPAAFQPYAPLPNNALAHPENNAVEPFVFHLHPAFAFPLPENNAVDHFGLQPNPPFALPLPANHAVDPLALQPALPFQMQQPALPEPAANALALNNNPAIFWINGEPFPLPIVRRAQDNGFRSSGSSIERWSRK